MMEYSESNTHSKLIAQKIKGLFVVYKIINEHFKLIEAI